MVELEREKTSLASLKDEVSSRKEAVENLEELARKFEIETEVHCTIVHAELTYVHVHVLVCLAYINQWCARQAVRIPC